VVTVHDVVAFRPGSHYLRTGVKYRMLYRAAASADRVVVPSERTRADFAELFHPKSVVTVSEAVPKSFRRPITDSELWEVRAQFGLDGPFLLAVGDLGGGPHTDRKNLKALVSALASLGSVAESWTLVFAGRRGDHTAELERLAHGLGCGDRVRFLGYVDATQLPAVYVAAELLVYPSLYEGFGLPALAVGTPVLATADAVADEFIGGCVHQTGPEEQRLKASLERLMASSELRR
jgi:glycosyltransferase involved in cell wall biosynthesis